MSTDRLGSRLPTAAIIRLIVATVSLTFGSCTVADESNAVDQDFILTYTTQGGPVLGDDVYEKHISLKIDSSKRLVEMERNRSPSDEAGEPIGKFEAPLTDESLERLKSLAYAARLDEMPPATGGGPGVGVIQLTFEVGETRQSALFTDRDFAALEQTDALVFTLNQAMAGLLARPTSALQLSLARLTEQRFELKFTNTGSRPICMRDPRLNEMDGIDTWTGVRVAAYPEPQPGFTEPPLEWSQVNLDTVGAVGGQKDIRLEAGESVSMATLDWRPSLLERHLVQGVHSDYGKPSTTSGCYPIRGAVFSSALELKSP